GALYFGVKILLERCKTWFSEVASSTEPPQIRLDDLISIWNFGFKHANDFLPELCASFLAKNFMWAISCKSFVDVPYSLLHDCVKHPCLTIESEMHLYEALFLWVDANTEDFEGLRGTENNYSSILKQIRLSLLPLWFAAGKRRNCHFSRLVYESINSIFRLLKVPPTGSISFLEGCDLSGFRIRLTRYSKKMNLSSCPQITSAILLLSLLPSSNCTDSMLRRSIKQLLTKLESLDRDPYSISLELLPLLSFEAVQEVDISKCQRLHLRAAIECFSVSFPSLKTLKAAYLLNFSTTTLHQLLLKCPMICEVDLTIDINPIISEVSNNLLTTGVIPVDVSPLSKSKLRLSNITKLILEGRMELRDSDLLYISKFCIYLQHVNLKGCTALTDVGMSDLIHGCVRLKSILVCHTSFGINSVLALCSSLHGYGNTSNQLSESMAFNLQTLHIGYCKCVDETSFLKLLSETHMLKSLCLRDTQLTDHALCNLPGSSLENLDVSDTMVSGAALARIIYRNPGLKCLRVKGCKNLCQRESNAEMGEVSCLNSCGELEMALGKTCRLEEISLGWGFSHFSMEALKPAITSLRKMTVGLGGSLGEGALMQLPTSCPLLESIVLHFQVLSDSIIVNIMETLRNLQVLALCYCLGDISIKGFKFYMPNLRKLQLERVTPWMTNEDLVILTQGCPNIVKLSLLGCPRLDSASQQIISRGWPGLLSIHIEECGKVTADGVSSLLECVALEDLLLRHNGPGIHSSFILDAVSKMPLLRQVSLDLCDANRGYFDVPPDDEKCFLRSVKIARCKSRECGLTLPFLEPRRKRVHKETLVLVRTSENVIRTVVKERL
ncbi:hypothetical protein TorRG33x02_297610, partial [Trema orientale]